MKLELDFEKKVVIINANEAYNIDVLYGIVERLDLEDPEDWSVLCATTCTCNKSKQNLWSGGTVLSIDTTLGTITRVNS